MTGDHNGIAGIRTTRLTPWCFVFGNHNGIAGIR
jgi:hypothetical protein